MGQHQAQEGKTDAKKGKLLLNSAEIAIAVKMGGPDPAANSRLRDAIARLKLTICQTTV